MGSIVVGGYGVLAVLALVLIGLGAYRRARTLVLVGGALLLVLAGAWVFGLRQ